MTQVYSMSIMGVTGRLAAVAHNHDDKALRVSGVSDVAARDLLIRARAALRSYQFETKPTGVVTIEHRGGSATQYDLAVAIASAVHGAPVPDDTVFLGELSFSGELRPIRGLIPMLLEARETGFLKRAVVPMSQLHEASIVTGIDIRGARSLAEVLANLRTNDLPSAPEWTHPPSIFTPDLEEMVVNPLVIRAMEISAASGLGLLLMGTSRKTTALARCMPGILPALTPEEALDIAAIQSAAGIRVERFTARMRPFRAPHHTVSAPGLIGGGKPVHAGEATLADEGVLFLDELPEFRRQTLGSLAEVIGNGSATFLEGEIKVRLPATTLLVAAMSPCPRRCFAMDSKAPCRCPLDRVNAWMSRITPIVQHLQICVDVDSPGEVRSQPSSVIRERVTAAQERWQARDESPSKMPISDDAQHELEALFGRNQAVGRQIATAIAHLAGWPIVAEKHVREAREFSTAVQHFPKLSREAIS